MDIATPRNVPLSAFYRRSNAVMNAQEIIPNCLMAIANELTSRSFDIKQQYGQDAADELKSVITKIQSLRDEVLQDAPFRKLLSSGPDVKFYNDYLEKMTSQDCRPTMMQTVRVYAECYVYRRVWECFELTTYLTDFDPYESMKRTLFGMAVPIISKIGFYLKNIYKYPSEEDKDDFEKLIKLNLWSNQCDLIMSEKYVNQSLSEILKVQMRDSLIVSNQTDAAWEVISDRNHPSNVVAFICDNAGLEFFLELCVADYLYTNFYARTIHFHVKYLPWFISDAMEQDVDWMLNQLGRSPEKHIQELAATWKEHFKCGRWKIVARKYWTLPFGFSRMKEIDPILYKMLEDTKMVVIKGDLNYRKLVEDMNTDPSRVFLGAFRNFYPTNLLLIRIMRSDLICNISRREIDRLEKVNKHWMYCGRFGLIQFAPKPTIQCDCLGS